MDILAKEPVAIPRKTVNLRGLARRVYKQMGKAIAQYDMLHEGDRILVAVSGGEDSLSLLKLFQMRQRRVPLSFELVACFVNTSFITIDHEGLVTHVRGTGIPFVVKDLPLDREGMNCFWCSWNRRKVLFETAREQGCNKVALGHHMDDIAQTTLMNLFFLGEISTSPPALDLFGGEIKLIRPLCFIEKKDLAAFARQLELPVTGYECEYGKRSQRQVSKEIIEKVEETCPYVKKNIFRALGRIRKEYLV